MSESPHTAEKARITCGDVTWLNPGGYYICDRSQDHDGDHFDREKARAWPQAERVITPVRQSGSAGVGGAGVVEPVTPADGPTGALVVPPDQTQGSLAGQAPDPERVEEPPL